MFVSFFERLFKGDNAKSVINMPNPDNPKTFTKQYNKTETISYSLQGSQMLTAKMAADHTVRMQPFVNSKLRIMLRYGQAEACIRRSRTHLCIFR